MFSVVNTAHLNMSHQHNPSQHPRTGHGVFEQLLPQSSMTRPSRECFQNYCTSRWLQPHVSVGSQSKSWVYFSSTKPIVFNEQHRCDIMSLEYKWSVCATGATIYTSTIVHLFATSVFLVRNMSLSHGHRRYKKFCLITRGMFEQLVHKSLWSP